MTTRTTASVAPPLRRRGTTGRRTAAVLAILAAGWTLLLTLIVSIDDFPRGLLVLLCIAVMAAGAWEGVLRRGWGRVAGLAVGVGGLAGAGVLAWEGGCVSELLLLGLGVIVWHGGSRLAFQPRVALTPAVAPRRPVLFINPRSGDG